MLIEVIIVPFFPTVINVQRAQMKTQSAQIMSANHVLEVKENAIGLMRVQLINNFRRVYLTAMMQIITMSVVQQKY